MATHPDISTSPYCYHCGDVNFSPAIEKHGKQFCCNGCLTVYELLSENDLQEYYQFDNGSGNKIADGTAGLRYAFLDLEEIKEKILLFSEGNLEKVKFKIPSIHCSSCIWLLENLHRLYPAILHSQVNFLKKEATISYNKEKISTRKIAELLFSIGYAADFNFDDINRKDKVFQHKNLAIQLGVAGFCFGNVMLLSFPEYLSNGDLLNFEYHRLFDWLNLALAIPVVFYSSSSYFTSAFKSLRKRFLNIDLPISLGIFTLFTRSLYEIVTNSGAGYLDSLTGLVFFLLIGKWFQEKTYASIAFDKDYKSYFPIAITKLDGEKEIILPLDKVKKGDLLMIHPGELIPCDSLLLDSTADIDYSFVTGESETVHKKANDKLFAGGKSVNKGFRIEVLKEISQSYLIELWNQDAFLKSEKGKESTLINVVSKYFTMVILSIAFISAAYWYFVQPELIWQVATAVLIVACPCALALSAPFTFGSVIRKFGENGFFLKSSSAIEELSKCNAVVFDKTGTLTESNAVELIQFTNNLSREEVAVFATMAGKSSHPISKALKRELQETAGIDLLDFKEVTAEGLLAFYNNREFRLGSSRFLNLIEDIENKASFYLAVDGKVKASYVVSNKFRNGLSQVIKELSESHSISLLSGDQSTEKERLKAVMPPETELLFRQSPYEKLNYIKNLQLSRKRVIMIGDGLNDAGALKQSNFGIAVSESINHFSPSCDAILDSKKFQYLPFYLNYGKKAMNIIRACILISLLYNVVGLYLAVSAAISPLVAAILMPLSSVSVVLFIALAISITFRLPHKRKKYE